MRSHYGAHAIIELARCYGQGPVQCAEIAARQQIPEAYLDQLHRTNGISPQRAKTITDVLSKADQLRTGKESSAPATLTALDAAAAQVEGDAKAATGIDQKRLNALADTLRRRAAGLR